jgi:uncharacterized protein (TIGR02246 family)
MVRCSFPEMCPRAVTAYATIDSTDRPSAEATMGAKDPKQLHELFARYYNAQDVDGLASLYEKDAVYVSAPGSSISGIDAIREALGTIARMGAKIEFDDTSVELVNGDIALTHGRWRLKSPDGTELMQATTAEVARRSDDGLWRYAIDNPYGTAALI